MLTDLYDQVRQLHEAGLTLAFWAIDPEVFPIYLGLPWGLGVGPVPKYSIAGIYAYSSGQSPIRFEHYGEEASKE